MTNKYLLGIVSFILVLLSHAALASVSGQAEELYQTGVFGIITKTPDGKEVFQITNTVPYVEGQSYGWRIRLGPEFTRVKWKEVFELPASPETWGIEEAGNDVRISEDRKVSITEKEVVVEDGNIQNFWKVAAGDPLGEYVIRVYINEFLHDIFYFNVVKK